MDKSEGGYTILDSDHAAHRPLPTQEGQEIRTTPVAKCARNRRRRGLIQLRISKRGKPYVNISKIDVESLMAVSQEWEIQPDFANNPPFQILPVRTTTKDQETWEVENFVTSIRVNHGDWTWFKNECRANGTSTCREIRKWIHLAREDAEYPASLRRGRGEPGRYVG